PTNLFESELFGYKRGAFTDAHRDKPGRITLAEGGTIFFDEVGDLPLETQVKLLRLLQEREYTPLGSLETRQANVRIVAATNRDLSTLVSQGRFRDDLYFRLAVVRLTIPSLARRREDVPYLVEHFVQRFNAKQGKRIQGVTPAVMQILMRHEFPGNVRELENIIEYAFVLCRNGLIDVAHLPDDLQGREGSEPLTPARVTALQESECSALRQAIARNDGHLGRTARELGISRTTLWRKMKKHCIRRDEAAYPGDGAEP
ncbi:MAG: sigma 54-interacting transcriptional regulator, partial [Gemmatimonadetes bacterium]|nr:sigma 54-interacting transcriptional regulator [Gemmatimonadota bacterium]